MEKYFLPVLKENLFWLQIMFDHSEIILDRLPSFGTKVAVSKGFTVLFGNLIDRINKNPEMNADGIKRLNHDANHATEEFRDYVLSILKDQVTKRFCIYLKPEYLSNMVSLTDKYLYILGANIKNREPEFNPVVQDIFWLPIFISDSRMIADNIGIYEEDIRQKAEQFTNHFIRLIEFSLTLQGIFRIGTTDFPIANQHRKKILDHLNNFAEFVVEIIQLVRENRLPRTFSDHFLDSTYRKLCYYTTQLAIIAKKQKPACDPASPRLSTIS